MERLLLSACTVLVAFASGAQTNIAWSTPVDCNGDGDGAQRPRIALNVTGSPAVLWGRMEPNRNSVAVWNGAAFSTPIEVSGPGCEPSVAYWMGSSLAAAGNTVWVVMKAMPEEAAPIYVRRSDDGG